MGWVDCGDVLLTTEGGEHMLKKMTTLVLATGLATAAAVGAHAQTINGFDLSNNQIFQVLVTPTVTPNLPAPGPFTYLYNLTLEQTTPGVNVDTFAFNFNTAGKVIYDNLDTTPGYGEASLKPGAFTFGGPGLVNVGDNATFAFTSPFPPTGTVGVTSDSSIGGGGHASIGPGPVAVPEASTFALLGLGMLPLALMARRRMASRN